MTEYPNYKLYFTVMALGAYNAKYVPKLKSQARLPL